MQYHIDEHHWVKRCGCMLYELNMGTTSVAFEEMGNDVNMKVMAQVISCCTHCRLWRFYLTAETRR